MEEEEGTGRTREIGETNPSKGKRECQQKGREIYYEREGEKRSR